ncbi:hypothetical protein A3A21_02635 [Candidatus Jorgensenbacteria bacterium RIFCSPLOWO2_01_FULL_45_25b]|uniref:Sodium/calcium exchanger membrane region domain-containing protein n=1 Tax=Candidatus Jorgensenbacteria bacterium RIFCSPLOWO2_01_FULL_45_25b TaxID=1798471 RepID=A0A1F6BZS9_9BACT|nr:MAG: hypothetical protein A3A21_02635 [Candidatus Jorgensenbacteria bacterium RIFCSPLOWO2_01_FULL_45_25b]
MILHIVQFFISVCLLYVSGRWLVNGLSKVAGILKWKKFTLSFLVMAFAASLPNLFVGISSALRGIPELSFGDVMGGNVIDLTLAIGLAALFAKRGIPARGKTVQYSAFFAVASALAPALLIVDGTISRFDGILLFMLFASYIVWLSEGDNRFKKTSESEEVGVKATAKIFFGNALRIIAGVALIIIAAEGIMRSALFFAHEWNISIGLIGILIVGLGNALPETYFAILSARKGETDMILGDMLSSIIVPATLILSIVSMIHPIVLEGISSFMLVLAFLVLGGCAFLWSARSGKKLSRKEGIFLVCVYLLFIALEVGSL